MVIDGGRLPPHRSTSIMTKRALIIANGEPPKKSLLQALVKEVQLVVCADGGANTALKLGVTPHAIVGDMDSIHTETFVKFHKVPGYEDSDQESTDLEKAIAWTIKQKFDHITVTGGLGKRIDHTVSNLGLIPKFFPDAVIRIVDDIGELSLVGSGVEFDAKVGTTISLIPLGRCEGITTVGLRYPLSDDYLEPGLRDGTSNVVVSSPVIIRVKKGNLLLFKMHAAQH